MARVTKLAPGLSYSIRIVGGRRASVRDLYHALLRMPWWAAIAVIAGTYLVVNALFATAFLVSGGVANARPGSFVDAFFFSVQTLGTIGYGAMYPVSAAANALVVAESICGLIVTALSTGLVFVRFSLTQGRLVFSEKMAISPMDGVPTLTVRIGNDRSNQIYDAHLGIVLMMSTLTREGARIYRGTDLKLVREKAPALARSWNILHRIDPTSPLHGLTPEQLVEREAELTVTVSGTDDTSLQPVHGRHVYEAPAIVFGARLADVLSETEDGNMLLDLNNFHALVATEPTAEFPYPRR